MSRFISDRERTLPGPARSDVLFHVERPNGRIDEFRKGDLAMYYHQTFTAVTIVDVPDTVMGHFKETTDGKIICLDICTVLIDGELKNVETDKVFHLRGW